GAIAGEDKMSVGVDETGDHSSSPAVEDLAALGFRRIGGRSCVGDQPLVDGDDGVAYGVSVVRGEVADAREEQAAHRSISSPVSIMRATASISPASTRSPVRGGTTERTLSTTAPAPDAGPTGWGSRIPR